MPVYNFYTRPQQQVRVSVMNVAAEHAVKIQDFNGWLRKEGGTPRDRTDRNRVRAILGVNEQRRV